jgi:hypothetical protein
MNELLVQRKFIPDGETASPNNRESQAKPAFTPIKNPLSALSP